MVNEATAVIAASKVKYLFIMLVPFVEPQLAGMLGSLAYLIVRHELNMASLSIKSIMVVMFFGWLGAWATVNLIAHHWTDCPHVWEHIISATVGFLMYDAMLGLGANTTSVVGWVGNMIKETLERIVRKWNS